LLANDVQLVTGNHTFARRDLPIRAQPTEERPIVIEDDVWLGASAIVLGGVTIGQGSVVAAGSIVTRSLPPYSIARGVPARITGARGEESAALEVL
jgi:acetyltransferase-like isoleucine patch superfamily enzyme